MRSSPEVEAVVRRWMTARGSGDADLAASFYSDSEHLWLIGSDEHEWISGPQGAVLVSKDQWEVLGPFEFEILRIHAFEAGSVGWVLVEVRWFFDADRPRVSRMTFVLELEGAAWKIVHTHASDPVPNLESIGVELSRTLADLVDSLDGDVDPLGGSGISGTATLMFTDIVDSTRLSLQMGEEAWHDVITAHIDSLRDIVEEHGGSVVKTLGDGGMFVFDSGSAALRAAVRIQQAVSQASDPEIRLRVGVHTGDVVQTDDDYVGVTVAKAARVATAADGGQTLVSTSTAGMVSSSEFEFGDPITVELKGLDGTHQLHPLTWS